MLLRWDYVNSILYFLCWSFSVVCVPLRCTLRSENGVKPLQVALLWIVWHLTRLRPKGAIGSTANFLTPCQKVCCFTRYIFVYIFTRTKFCSLRVVTCHSTVQRSCYFGFWIIIIMIVQYNNDNSVLKTWCIITLLPATGLGCMRVPVWEDGAVCLCGAWAGEGSPSLCHVRSPIGGEAGRAPAERLRDTGTACCVRWDEYSLWLMKLKLMKCVVFFCLHDTKTFFFFIFSFRGTRWWLIGIVSNYGTVL